MKDHKIRQIINDIYLLFLRIVGIVGIWHHFSKTKYLEL